MVDIKVDSHKLSYHVERVHAWTKGRDIYPVYVEISPSGTCQHRCIFCAFDYLNYKPQFIDKDVLMKTLSEMARCGVKSVMFSGEGEPFLHKSMPDFILHAKKAGLDVAAAMNGVLFTPDIAKRCLKALTWIKISINAGTGKTYGKIHGCQPQDFKRVLHNLKEAIRLKRRHKYSCTIGAQMVLLPENISEAAMLAGKLKRIGVEYLVIKPFIKHPMSPHNISRDFRDKELADLEKKLKKISSPDFQVYFRAHGFFKLNQPRAYKQCLGLPFFCEITSNGNIFTCGPYLGNLDFCYGNIYKNSFVEIWRGMKRRRILKMVSSRLDPRKCMKNCRLDEVNRYLWEVKHHPAHANFI